MITVQGFGQAYLRAGWNAGTICRATIIITFAMVTALLFFGGSHAQEAPLLTQISRLELPKVQSSLAPGRSATIQAWDLCVEDDLAAVAAGPLIHLIDVSIPETPQLRATIHLQSGIESTDVKLKDELLFAGLQRSDNGASLLIYNVANPDSPEQIGQFIGEKFAGAHNIFVTQNVAFLATSGALGSPSQAKSPGNIGFGLALVDISDPTQPQEMGIVMDDLGRVISQVHDVTVVDNIAYLAAWQNGFWIVEFDNLDDPQNLDHRVIAHHTYKPGPSGMTHNVWPSSDRRILWTTDERLTDGVRAFDISDPEHIQLLGYFSLGSGSIPHNVVVNSSFAYLSYYYDGLRVLEITDEGVTEVASHQTTSNDEASFRMLGAFGVFPTDQHVFVSDTEGGLFVFQKGGRLIEVRD